MKFYISTLFLVGLAAGQATAQCSDLFFSEYIEGTGNNKGLEIFNPTLDNVDLSAYRVQRYSNGQSSPAVINGKTDQTTLVGTLASLKTHVLINGQKTEQVIDNGTTPPCDPELQALANQLDGIYPSPTYMNGNDAIVLQRNINGTFVIIDIIGKIGENPGFGWGTNPPYTGNVPRAENATENKTLVRKASVTKGVSTNPDIFRPLVEWDTFRVNTWDFLGSHQYNSPAVARCNSTTSRDVESYINNLVTIGPSPTRNTDITLTAQGNLSNIQVMDLNGRLIPEAVQQQAPDHATLAYSLLPRGMVFVRFTLDGRLTVTRKLIVE